jgi:hypothetical protein
LPPELTPDDDDFHFDSVDAEFVDDDIRVEHEPAPEAPVPAAEAPEAAVPEVPAPELPAREAPARPRLGLGSFADLRGATAPPAYEEAPGPAASTSDAPSSAAPAAADPDLPSTLPSDRRASFAEVAQAVDDAARPGDAEPAGSPFSDSEDFLPQRLPKRGRRASRLETPCAKNPVAIDNCFLPKGRDRRRRTRL